MNTLALLFFLLCVVTPIRKARWCLVRWFGFPIQSFRTLLLAWFATVITLGWGMGMVIAWFRFSTFSATMVLLANIGWWFWLERKTIKIVQPSVSVEEKLTTSTPLLHFALWPYLVLVLVSFGILAHSQTGASISSPWQVLPSYFIVLFALATLCLGTLVFSRVKTSTLLILFSLHFLLIGSYLPLTHQLLYGADGWRHIGTELSLLQTGERPNVVLRDQPHSPVQYFSPGRFTYAQFWGTLTLVAHFTNFDLLTLQRWWQPILWALLFPVLTFEIVLALGWGMRRARFAPFMAMFPFALHAAAAFTLPVSFGLLTWLLLFLVILKYVAAPTPIKRLVLAVAGIFSFFGYTLFFLLYWLVYLVAEAYVWLAQKANRKIIWGQLLVTIAVAAVIPALELITHYSSFSVTTVGFRALVRLVSNLLGIYVARGPSAENVGNILLNQPALTVFVPNIFTFSRWWLVVCLVIFWVFVMLGLRRAYLSSASIQSRVAATLTLGLFGSYFVSRYVLAGENIFARRLDGVLAFLTILFFLYGIAYAYECLSPLVRNKKTMWYLVSGGVIIFSAMVAASWSLGPTSSAASVDELAAVRAIVNEIPFTDSSFCVMADPIPLVLLEATTAGKIVGGGFPIDDFFAQPELKRLQNTLLQNPDEKGWSEALALTHARFCYLLTDKTTIKVNAYAQAEVSEMRFFDTILLWSHTDDVSRH